MLEYTLHSQPTGEIKATGSRPEGIKEDCFLGLSFLVLGPLGQASSPQTSPPDCPFATIGQGLQEKPFYPTSRELAGPSNRHVASPKASASPQNSERKLPMNYKRGNVDAPGCCCCC